MALYKTSLNIIVKHSRLFTVIIRKESMSWHKTLMEHPLFLELRTQSNLSKEQWTNFRQRTTEVKGIDDKTVDVILMKFCISTKNLNLGKSYHKYLCENKYNLNLGFIGSYFQLLHSFKHVLTDDDKKEILTLYDNLRSKYQILDTISAECCILAISLTEKWRDALELIEMIKISNSPPRTAYSALIIAAFEHGDSELGFKYLDEMLQIERVPLPEVYIACINYCSRTFTEPDACIGKVEKLFDLISQYNIVLPEIVIKYIKEIYEKFGWVGTYIQMKNEGICKNCNQKLAPLKLSEQDFSRLSKTILDTVLIGDNVYFKTTPYELKKFTNFINKTKPYDIVIDGLNVAYNRKDSSSGTNGSMRLATVVRYFLDKNQVVLVLGRKHMMKWNKRHMDYIKKNCYLFLTNDLSADDPCLLYATLMSGPQTKFISNDLMRQHKFSLKDPTLRQIFKQWQMSHQCFVSFKKNMSFIPPLEYLPVPQKVENCWHIPFQHPDQPLTESYEAPKDWLCLKRPKSTSK